jgi:hypothetical protein
LLIRSSMPDAAAAAAAALALPPAAGESHTRDRDRLQPGSSRRVDRSSAAASSGSCHGWPAWHEHPRPGCGPHAGLWWSAGLPKHVSAAGCAWYGWWHPGIEPAAGLPTTAINALRPIGSWAVAGLLAVPGTAGGTPGQGQFGSTRCWGSLRYCAGWGHGSGRWAVPVMAGSLAGGMLRLNPLPGFPPPQ